jgi:hypothetical protein
MKRVVAIVLVAVVYAWWTSGVTPFTTMAYVLIAIPSVIALAAYIMLGALSPWRKDVTRFYRENSEGVRLAAMVPWLVVLVLALALEVVALALGGRSRDVPSLSTTVDHLLVWHWGRCLLYLGWLCLGAVPIFRLWQFRRREVT